MEAVRLRRRDVSPGVLLEGSQIFGEGCRIRKIRDLYKLDLIGTLAAMAEHMLEEEILCPAMLAATSKRYKVPAERIIGWLKPPGYFTGGSFVHMARDNILRGSYEKRMPAMFEIVWTAILPCRNALGGKKSQLIPGDTWRRFQHQSTSSNWMHPIVMRILRQNWSPQAIYLSI